MKSGRRGSARGSVRGARVPALCESQAPMKMSACTAPPCVRPPLVGSSLRFQAATSIRNDNMMFGVAYDEQAELVELTADDVVEDDAVEGERPGYIGLPNSPWRLKWSVYEVLLLLFIAVSLRALPLREFVF